MKEAPRKCVPVNGRFVHLHLQGPPPLVPRSWQRCLRPTLYWRLLPQPHAKFKCCLGPNRTSSAAKGPFRVQAQPRANSIFKRCLGPFKLQVQPRAHSKFRRCRSPISPPCHLQALSKAHQRNCSPSPGFLAAPPPLASWRLRTGVWPPPLTANARPCLRAYLTASTTSLVPDRVVWGRARGCGSVNVSRVRA
eukprot:143123-Chlamydomonas_euryale.AAC.2